MLRSAVIAIQPRMIGTAECADPPREAFVPRCPTGWKGVGGGFVGRCAHAVFTRQKVCALRRRSFSSLTSSSTVMRQLMVSPFPCATMLAKADGAVVDNVKRPRQGDAERLLRLGVEVEVIDVGRVPPRRRCRR